MDKILVSACLIGNNVKYNGKNNLNLDVLKLKDKYEIIPICPEVLGGLPIPRIAAEVINDKVINKNGIDVTNNFILGAKKVLSIAQDNNILFAILKDGSPSCGKNYIYDGSFSGIKINNYGITTKLLIENNIKIYSENEIEELL